MSSSRTPLPGHWGFPCLSGTTHQSVMEVSLGLQALSPRCFFYFHSFLTTEEKKAVVRWQNFPICWTGKKTMKESFPLMSQIHTSNSHGYKRLITLQVSFVPASAESPPAQGLTLNGRYILCLESLVLVLLPWRRMIFFLLDWVQYRLVRRQSLSITWELTV